MACTLSLRASCHTSCATSWVPCFLQRYPPLPPNISKTWITICKSLKKSRFDREVQNTKQGTWMPFWPCSSERWLQCSEANGCGDMGEHYLDMLSSHLVPYHIPISQVCLKTRSSLLAVLKWYQLLSKISIERKLILDSTHSCNICIKHMNTDLILPACLGTVGCRGHCAAQGETLLVVARRQSWRSPSGLPAALRTWHESTQLCTS